MRVLIVLSFIVLFPGSAFAQSLTLNEAITIALKEDSALAQIGSFAQSLSEKSVSEGQLPDPKASMALQNFPVDDFSRSREGMTQVVMGVSQAFPRGSSLEYKQEKTQSMAKAQRRQYEDKKREVKRSVRKAWLDLYYWRQAARTVERSEKLLKKVIRATESHYGTGKRRAQDVIAAELELSVLQDKKIDVEKQIETARAELAKWVGQSLARGDLQKSFPLLPELKSYEDLKNLLPQHPKIKIADEVVAAERHGVSLAEEQYKPGFEFGVNYGMRENRTDMVSARVGFDIPIFTGKRQDKNLSASRYNLKSAEYKRTDMLRELKTSLEQEYSNWRRLSERTNHYEKIVTKQASENFEASLRAYQEDRTDFSSLIRAQVMELNTQLKSIKLKVDKAKAQASLLYLQGDNV